MPTELRLSPGAPAAPVPPRRGPPEAEVGRGRRRLSVVWLVPLVAAAIGVGLALLMRHMSRGVRLLVQTGLLLAWSMPVVAPGVAVP